MKIILNLTCLLIITGIAACKYFKSDHPQSEMVNQAATTGMNEESIREFTTNLDQSTGQLNKTYSLVYTTGDGSMYVEQYASGSGDQLLIENTQSDLKSAVRKYYFKRDSLILVSEQNIESTEKGKVVKDTKTYLRNFVVFKRAVRSAASVQAIQGLPFLTVKNEEGTTTENFRENIRTLQDALKQQHQFDVVFDNVTTYPDASFIMLKSKEQTGYKASVRLTGKDQYVDSLINYPENFRNERLSLKWTVSNGTAVYVPEESTSTSASGLNR
jgi:hypothetical protein